MDVFAELRREERHERRAAIVDISDLELRRAARKLCGIPFGPFEKAFRRHRAVAVGRVKDPIVFLEPLREPLGCAVILPTT